MTDHEAFCEPRDGRTHIVRVSCAMLAVIACLMLVPAVTAGADVMPKYRTAYKAKLNKYRTLMDTENTFYNKWSESVASLSGLFAEALADPGQQQFLPQLEQSALSMRSELQDAVRQTRTRIYANIAAFRTTGVRWFRARADKTRFKDRLATMRSGFVEVFAADEDLMSALWSLSDADITRANAAITRSGFTATTARDLFARGLSRLRALR